MKRAFACDLFIFFACPKKTNKKNSALVTLKISRNKKQGGNYLSQGDTASSSNCRECACFFLLLEIKVSP